MLQIIHDDELTHVSAGHRHFTNLCAELGVDSIKTFRQEVQTHFYGSLRGPYNEEDREKAGLTRSWYEDLQGRAFHDSAKEVGEKGSPVEDLSGRVASLVV